MNKPNSTGRQPGTAITDEIETIVIVIDNQIKKGVSPLDETYTNFNKPFIRFARHASSGKLYQGTNHLLLTKIASNNFYMLEDWASAKEWQTLGETVRAGEKPHLALQRQYRSTGSTGTFKTVPMMTTVEVFNRCQLSSYQRPEYFPWQIPPTTFERLAIIDTFVENTKAVFEYGEFCPNYSTRIDTIRMPSAAMFIDTEQASSRENFYAMQFQQLAKWAMYQLRLVQQTTMGNVHANIAAELCAALLCERFHLNTLDTARHAAFIGEITSTLNENEFDVTQCKILAESAMRHLYSMQPFDCSYSVDFP
ncbi:ArdC-like ssDNA-binding domain-containing protein [Mucilaginibacter pedocola]|uniref:Uncharacterized protein n=1 Tax=Mucilaginibacter pedocola TaxID=1792845 RepID=A0A1S9PMM2_9SPHI|nr:ArdC-like ssDNA-binding domain-containing protein [Mucilaginibacter pedocola]OOQ62190.1 hypothetical protein BC343_03865 [Mucilaginibacter pedocola]